MARKKKVTFSFNAPEAREVKLAGSFTGWQSGAIIMNKGRAGVWKADVTLEPGEYEYKFLADGNWQNDPAADAQQRNDQGIENSVRRVA